MQKYWGFLVRGIIKRIERLPRGKRLLFNLAIRNLQIPTRLAEHLRLKELENDKVEALFEMSREIGFCEFRYNDESTIKLMSFANLQMENHLSGNLSKTNSKDYLRQIWDLSKIDNDSLFVLDWALKNEVLKSVSKYMHNRIPRLHEISVFYSPQAKIEANKNWQGSQLFHMDGGGTRCVKIWLLCQDVSTENGPTVVTPANLSEEIARSIKYKPGTKISYEQESNLFNGIDKKELVGKAGTWFATDTDRSFHYGSRTTSSSSRLVFMFHYIDGESSYCMPILSAHYKKQMSKLPELIHEQVSTSNLKKFVLGHRLN